MFYPHKKPKTSVSILWETRENLDMQGCANVAAFLDNSVDAALIDHMNKRLYPMRRDVAVAIVAYMDVKREAHHTHEEVMSMADELVDAMSTKQAA